MVQVDQLLKYIFYSFSIFLKSKRISIKKKAALVVERMFLFFF